MGIAGYAGPAGALSGAARVSGGGVRARLRARVPGGGPLSVLGLAAPCPPDPEAQPEPTAATRSAARTAQAGR